MKIESLRIQELYEKIKSERLDLSWVANRKFDDTVLELFELTCNPEHKNLAPEYLKISQEQFASTLAASPPHTIFLYVNIFSYFDDLFFRMIGSIEGAEETFLSANQTSRPNTWIEFAFAKGICEERVYWRLDTAYISDVTKQYARWKETQNILEKYKK